MAHLHAVILAGGALHRAKGGPLVQRGHQVVALAAADPAETRGIYSEEEALHS